VLSMLSCGNAVSPPAEGGVSVAIGNPTSGGGVCPGSALLELAADPPSNSDPGTTWIDGRESHQVNCSVKGSGTYDFNGTIQGNKSNFTIDGTVERGGTGTATVAIFETKLAIGLRGENCVVDARNNYTVEKGAIWAGVECNDVGSSDFVGTQCRVRGTFVFKSCED